MAWEAARAFKRSLRTEELKAAVRLLNERPFPFSEATARVDVFMARMDADHAVVDAQLAEMASGHAWHLGQQGAQVVPLAPGLRT